MAFLEKLLLQRLRFLYSHVLSFYITDLTAVFYVHIDIFKKFKYFMLIYLIKTCYCNFSI